MHIRITQSLQPYIYLNVFLILFTLCIELSHDIKQKKKKKSAHICLEYIKTSSRDIQSSTHPKEQRKVKYP